MENDNSSFNESEVAPQEKISSKKKEPEKNLELVDIIKMIAPGTAIRIAIEDILKSELGALIVIEKQGIYDIVEGGFRVKCRFSPQRLVELAKMDGAIILSKDMKKIIYANVLLVPDVVIQTKETGTRHKAAERTAKQLGAIVIAVSERKKKVTVYYRDLKYELEESSEILRRAAETLQILEKQKEIFNELISNLNILEVNNLVTISDVCSVLQRAEMINRISFMVKRYLMELGKEGIIVSMRLKELTKNLNKEESSILKDYFGSKYSRAETMLKNMGFDFLLENQNISRMLFDELHDRSISPRGLRILGKTELLEKDIKLLISTFKTLDRIFNADEESLLKIFKKKEYLEFFNKELENLKEKIMVGKKI
jgi:diadenylate cyclase